MLLNKETQTQSQITANYYSKSPWSRYLKYKKKIIHLYPTH